MPAKQIEDVGYVKERIAEIFGSEEVEYRLATKAGHKFHIFSNHDAIYTACHIASGRHESDDFYFALSQMWDCDGQMAVEGSKSLVERLNTNPETNESLGARVVDGVLGPAIVIDNPYVENAGGDEKAAEIMVNSLDDRFRYLCIVRVPKGSRSERNVLNIAAMVSYDFDLTPEEIKKTGHKTPYSQVHAVGKETVPTPTE